MIFNFLKIFIQNNMFNSTKMVLIVRKDLKMTMGKVASQCAHAALSAFIKQSDVKPNLVKKWLLQGQPKVVLSVSNLEALLVLQHKANSLNITSAVISDAGRTQIPTGTMTVLAIGPDATERIDSITKHLKLL